MKENYSGGTVLKGYKVSVAIRNIICAAIVFALAMQIFPCFGSSVKAAEPTAAFIIFNGPNINNVTASGMRVSIEGDYQGPSMVQVDGQWALKSSDYIYFFIDNPILRNAENVMLEVTYYDSNGYITINYCSKYPGEWGWDASGDIQPVNTNGVNAWKEADFQKSGSNKFQTALVGFDRCNFTKGHNQGAQFRFGYGTDIIIKSVKLTVGSLPNPQALPPPKFAPQTEKNNILNKAITGYQAWHFAGGTWEHWTDFTENNNIPPGPENLHVEMWPDVTEYEENGAVLYPTNYARLGDGRPAKLYSARDKVIIDTHFKWMNEYGIDCAAIQRFDGFRRYPGQTTTNHLVAIKESAEKYGRLFYVMYDLTGTNNIDSAEQLRNWKADFILNVEQMGIVSSLNYGHAEGKPVVHIWGLYGSEDYGEYGAVEKGGENCWGRMDVTTEMVRWLRERGYYIIGGIVDDQINWNNRSKEGQALYASVDMIFKWMTGSSESDLESMLDTMEGTIPPIQEFCKNHPRKWANNTPIDTMFTLWPGFGWSNMNELHEGEPNQMERRAGQFVWNQAYTLLKKYDIKNLFFAMFDEFDEGTAYMKAARDYFDIPNNQYILTLAADGWWLSSDFYLRTAGAIIEMMKDERKLRPENDVPHSLGPIYWRNSFEMRNARAKLHDGKGGVKIEPRPNQPVDPCLNNPARLTKKGSGAKLTANKIVKAPGKSGDYVFNFAGSGSGSVYYKIADVKITAVPDMEIIYSIKPLNEAGRGVFVDALFEDGSLLSEHIGGKNPLLGSVNAWNDIKISLPVSLAGKKITGVVVGYSGSGNFSAYVDDIVIQEAPTETPD